MTTFTRIARRIVATLAAVAYWARVIVASRRIGKGA